MFSITIIKQFWNGPFWPTLVPGRILHHQGQAIKRLPTSPRLRQSQYRFKSIGTVLIKIYSKSDFYIVSQNYWSKPEHKPLDQADINEKLRKAQEVALRIGKEREAEQKLQKKMKENLQGIDLS